MQTGERKPGGVTVQGQLACITSAAGSQKVEKECYHYLMFYLKKFELTDG